MKTIKRGYVKWEENGVFHKEPLYKHPDLLASASVEDQIAAEEVRRLNEAAEEFLLERELEGQEDAEAVLEALKAAPDDVLTAEQLAVDDEGNPVPEAVEPIDSEDLQTVEATKIPAGSITADMLAADVNDDSNNDGDSD
jgi:hypothetical protein